MGPRPANGRSWVLDSTFLDVRRFGLIFSSGGFGALEADRCRFERCTTGILLGSRWSPASKIKNSVLRDCGTGVLLDADFSVDLRGALIQGCTIVGSSFAGVIATGFAPPFGQEILVRNSILVGSGVDVSGPIVVQHSIADGGASGVGVIDVDPQFVDLAGGDLSLSPMSPAIDRGTSEGVAPGELDAVRRHRAVDLLSVPNTGVGSPNYVDLGAFEFSGTIGENGDCPARNNSAGFPGRLFARGSVVASDNDLTLLGDQLPPGQFGIFVTGQQGGLTPMAGGVGTLCLGGPIGRFTRPGEIVQVGPTGTVTFQVDLTDVPQPTAAVAIQAGETWRFQFWHRDVLPAGGGPTSQFSGVVTLMY